MGLIKISTLCAAAAAAVTVLPRDVDAHAFLLLPKTEFVTSDKNWYAYWVEADKVPPASSYNTGDSTKNSNAFTANYKKLNPPSLKEFILKNQVPSTSAGVPKGGTAECGLSKPNVTPKPLPDHIEFGNYNLQISGGLHPGPCEAWCDNEIVIPFTADCRTRFHKPIAYDKAKCVGKKRFTFYWLATHFAPWQVYIGCVPLQSTAATGTGSKASAVRSRSADEDATAWSNNTIPVGTVAPYTY